MHRKFQGSRVNPCKEVPASEWTAAVAITFIFALSSLGSTVLISCFLCLPAASTFEGWESESLEESKAVAAHYFLIRRKNSDEPWIPLKITSPGDQLTTAEPVREKTQNLPVYSKTTKLFGSISNCFQAAGTADDEGAATFTSLIHDQLGLLAIGTFGLREFADGELGDLEGFEMFVGTSESDLRSRLNIPEPADNVCLPGSSEKQVLEIGEGVCAQGCKRNSPVFGEGDLQVFGGYCWELRGACNVCEGGVEGDGTATCLKDPASGESTEKAKVEVDGAITVQKERKKMLSMQTFLDSYNSGLPPSLRTRSSEDKFLHRIAKFLGGKTQRSRRQLPGLECANDRRDSEVHEENGKHDDAKIANARSLAQRLFRLRSKSSSWIKPLTRVREPSCHVTKRALQQGKTGEGAQEENVICTDVAFTCGPHPPRRKRSGKPQLRDLFEQPREDRSTDDLLPKSSQVRSLNGDCYRAVQFQGLLHSLVVSVCTGGMHRNVAESRTYEGALCAGVP